MTTPERWLDPPRDLRLETGDLHIWRVWLSQQPPDHLVRLRQLLSTDEQERAARFHFPHHREWYIVARGTLRILLGRYLNRPPQSISFDYGDQGKPKLAGPASPNRLEFNVSHSHEVALMGFIWERPIGVDIEQIRTMKDMAQVAKRFFSPQEFAVWSAVPPDHQPLAFFNCWTRKEAYIKVIGEGLTHPLHRFVVTLKPGEAGRLLTVDGSEELAQKWQLAALHPTADYAAAVAVEGGWNRLRCWYFQS